MKHVEEFVKKYLALAKKTGSKYQLPYLTVLAQAALETGWGKSVKGNNFFGIKDSSLINEGVVETKTHEYENGEKKIIKDEFEGFASPESCFDFYGKFVYARFPHAAKVTTDCIDYVIALQSKPKAMYATDPLYVSKITKIISMISNVDKQPIKIEYSMIPGYVDIAEKDLMSIPVTDKDSRLDEVPTTLEDKEIKTTKVKEK